MGHRNWVFAFLFFLMMQATAKVNAADLLVPAQYATFQSAVAAAQSGDRILISAGTYTLNAYTPIYGITNLKIEGAGPSLTSIKLNRQLMRSYAQNLHFVGLHLDGSYVSYDGNTYRSNDALYASDLENVKFDNCIISMCHRGLALFTHNINIVCPALFSGVSFSNISEYGVLLGGYNSAHDAVFSKCDFKNVGTGIRSHPDHSNYNSVVKVFDCNFKACGRGIYMYCYVPNKGDFIMSRSYFCNGTGEQVYLDRINSCAIKANLFANSFIGIKLGSNSFSNSIYVYYNNFVGNNVAANIVNTTGVSLANNWWSHVTGPQHFSNPNGLGDPILDATGSSVVSPWLPLPVRW